MSEIAEVFGRHKALSVAYLPVGALKPATRNARTLWTRERICCDCGAKGEVRRDNPAERCQRCSGRINGAKGLAVMAELFPPRPKVTKPRESRRINRVCKMCAGSFTLPQSALSGKTNSSGNFCCRPCYNHWLRQTGGRRSRMKGWPAARAEAIRRAPFCALCGSRKRLHVHHVIAWRVTNDDAQDNLVPLCVRHHRPVEGMFLDVEKVFAGENLNLAKLALMSQLREQQDATRMKLAGLYRACGRTFEQVASARAEVANAAD